MNALYSMDMETFTTNYIKWNEWACTMQYLENALLLVGIQNIQLYNFITFPFQSKTNRKIVKYYKFSGITQRNGTQGNRMLT